MEHGGRIAGPPRGLWLGGFVVAMALAVAVVKPWGAPGPPPGPGSPSPGGSPATGASPSGATAPGPPGPLVGLGLSWQCEYSSGWRVFVLGPGASLPDGTLPGSVWAPDGSPAPPSSVPGGSPLGGRDMEPTRAWLAIAPLADAGGPGDPRIPVIRVIVESPPAIGYCAPTTGVDVQPPEIVATAWSVAGDGDATPVEIRSVTLPDRRDDGSEGLFAPATEPPAAWPEGRTVFRLSAPGGYERWFGVDVGSVNGPSPTPAPSPAPFDP